MYQSNRTYNTVTKMLENKLRSWDERQCKQTVHAKTEEPNHRPERPGEGEGEREPTGERLSLSKEACVSLKAGLQLPNPGFRFSTSECQLISNSVTEQQNTSSEHFPLQKQLTASTCHLK